MARNDKDKLLRLFDDREVIRNRDVAALFGITRQAAHYHLRRLVQEGELVLVGAGRGARYRRAGLRGPRRYVYRTAGLAEEEVWQELVAREARLRELDEVPRSVFEYALTELVNNAVDHSGAPEVEVVLEAGEEGGTIALQVTDEGEGIFEHLRRGLGLDSDLEALQELSKGKATTMPERHTGEGIFFVSKAADRFEVTSGRLNWVVDNVIDDMAVLELSSLRAGTAVRFEARPGEARPLEELFEEYTEDFEFLRTRTVIKLFDIGVRFVSRSEAKRLLNGLARFREVVLDFKGVAGVGQGFADEVFRVWARAHPEVRLIPENMSEPVRFMVWRALSGARR